MATLHCDSANVIRLTVRPVKLMFTRVSPVHTLATTMIEPSKVPRMPLMRSPYISPIGKP